MPEPKRRLEDWDPYLGDARTLYAASWFGSLRDRRPDIQRISSFALPDPPNYLATDRTQQELT
jgi:hypothetical protein